MMTSARNIGRTVAILLLVQMALAPVVNFVLMRPVLRAFLVNAAASSTQVIAAVLLGLLLGVLSLTIAITVFPLFRRFSPPMALWFLILSAIGFLTLAFENLSVLTMLTLSQEYAKAAGADAAVFQRLGAVASGVWKWAHYLNLLIGAGSLFVFYGLLCRFRVIPRVLSALGILAVLLMGGAIVNFFFTQRTLLQLFMPMGIAHLALVVWLLAKGFKEPMQPTLRAAD